MTLEVTMAKLNKKFGLGTICKASDAVGLKIQRFSTGSLALDVALGGGFVEGRINELVGQFSSYKSTLAICAAKQFLKWHGDRYVVWIDVEQAFDPQWLKYLGADLERFLLVSPASGEEAVDVICETLKEGSGVLVVIDSIAAITPFIELQESAEKQQMACQPRLVGKMIRKMVSALKGSLLSNTPKATVIALNQIRMKVGLVWGDPTSVPGGKALEHAVSIRVKLARKEYIYEELSKNGEKMKQTIGSHIGFTVLKNKCCGGVQERGMFTFYNQASGFRDGGTIDNANDMIPYGIIYDVIARQGNTWSYRNIKIAGKENFVEKLYGQKSLVDVLYNEILEAHLMRMQRKHVDRSVKSRLEF